MNIPGTTVTDKAVARYTVTSEGLDPVYVAFMYDEDATNVIEDSDVYPHSAVRRTSERNSVVSSKDAEVVAMLDRAEEAGELPKGFALHKIGVGGDTFAVFTDIKATAEALGISQADAAAEEYAKGTAVAYAQWVNGEVLEVARWTAGGEVEYCGGIYGGGIYGELTEDEICYYAEMPKGSTVTKVTLDQQESAEE